ncbi:MAG: PQQ-binding-like beta-propeller repeat protein [Sphingomonadaceae bacterium]
MRWWIGALLCAALPGCEREPRFDAPQQAAELPERLAAGAARVDQAYLSAAGYGSDWPAVGGNYFNRHYSPLDEVNAESVGELGLAWTASLPDRGEQQAVPVAVDGTVYFGTAGGEVFAFAGADGEELWHYDPKLSEASLADHCCGIVNRGVAVWKGKVYVGTLDGRLVALDAITGAQLWSTQVTDRTRSVSIVGAPVVARNLVFIGGAGSVGHRGSVSAHDANSGTLEWRFYTVPPTGDAPDGAASDAALSTARHSWGSGEWQAMGGGGSVSNAILYDPVLDQLYIGTGPGTPADYARRSGGSGDNLFLSSILALRPETGDYLWHFQQMPGDGRGHGATAGMILARIELEGERRPVLMQAAANGFMFLLGRRTGRLLAAEPYLDEVSWTQGYDPESGRPLGAGSRQEDGLPPPPGARDWQPMAYSPRAGLVYFAAGLPAAGEEEEEAAAAAIIAWDPQAGKAVWRSETEGAPGGMLVTRGGILFAATAKGLLALSASDGERLWSLRTSAPVVAAPSTFLVGGAQHLAFAAGDRLIVLKRGGRKAAPIAPPEEDGAKAGG